MQPIKNPIARLLLHLVLIIFVLYSTVPFMWTILQSLKNERQANSRTPLIIFKPTWVNYRDMWLRSTPDNPVALGLGLIGIVVILGLILYFAEYLPIPRTVIYWGVAGVVGLIIWSIPQFVDTSEFYDYFLNTLIVCIGVIAISVGFGCFSGYALARYRGVAALILLLAALAFRALPRLGFLLPYYWMGQRSGLYDTHLLVIITLAAVNQPFTIWMLRSFFIDVPREIEEAAMIDGASRFTAFIRVIVPIMWPGIIATSLFTLLLAYHEFLLVRILTQHNWTLAVSMGTFIGGVSVPGSVPAQSAAAVSAALPLVIVILLFQKHLVKGLSAGAVKG